MKPTIIPLGEHVANRLDRAEARKNVADVPLLEEGHRQVQEMMEQPGADLKAERILKNEDNKRADRSGADLDHHQQRETERENEQQIAVAASNDLIDRELHVKWSREEKNLENDGKNEDLNQRMGAAADSSPEDRKRQLDPVVLGQEFVGGSEFERHSGEML
jgi:hypothetical protein